MARLDGIRAGGRHPGVEPARNRRPGRLVANVEGIADGLLDIDARRPIRRRRARCEERARLDEISAHRLLQPGPCGGLGPIRIRRADAPHESCLASRSPPCRERQRRGKRSGYQAFEDLSSAHARLYPAVRRSNSSGYRRRLPPWGAERDRWRGKETKLQVAATLSNQINPKHVATRRTIFRREPSMLKLRNVNRITGMLAGIHAIELSVMDRDVVQIDFTLRQVDDFDHFTGLRSER